jgi:hypothetical protein
LTVKEKYVTNSLYISGAQYYRKGCFSRAGPGGGAISGWFGAGRGGFVKQTFPALSHSGLNEGRGQWSIFLQKSR